MARRGLEVVGLALAVVAATLCAPCTAQTPAPTSLAMPNCPPAPISLSPCIGYVFGVGSATLSSCCSQFQAFFQSQGPCLCAVSKLAPSPLGLFLGQAQAMIPNVCNLPSNPCDDVAGGAITVPAALTPPVASTTPPVTPLAPTAPVPSAATTTTATTPTATPADPDTSEAPPVPADDSPAAVTAPGQTTPAGAGSNTGSEVGSKIPELLHSAGARSASCTNAGSALITLFIAYALTMHV